MAQCQILPRYVHRWNYILCHISPRCLNLKTKRALNSSLLLLARHHIQLAWYSIPCKLKLNFCRKSLKTQNKFKPDTENEFQVQVTTCFTEYYSGTQFQNIVASSECQYQLILQLTYEVLSMQEKEYHEPLARQYRSDRRTCSSVA